MRQRPFSTMTQGDAVKNGSTPFRSRIGDSRDAAECHAAVVADRKSDEEVEGHSPSQAPARVVEVCAAVALDDARRRDAAVVEGAEFAEIERRLWPVLLDDRAGRRSIRPSAAAILARPCSSLAEK